MHRLTAGVRKTPLDSQENPERRVWGACFDREAIRGRWQSFLSYFGELIGVLSLPFHYLPVIPLLLTIPLSPCKLTQRL